MDEPTNAAGVPAQVLFATVEQSSVRCDVLVLEDARWAQHVLVAGTPVSICFLCDGPKEQRAASGIARAWASAMATIRLVLLDDDRGQQYMVMAVGDTRVVLSLPQLD
jgi:hypothetical protein